MIPDRSFMGPFIVMGTLLELVLMKDLRTLRDIEMLIKSMWRKQSISSIWVKLLFACLYIHNKEANPSTQALGEGQKLLDYKKIALEWSGQLLEH